MDWGCERVDLIHRVPTMHWLLQCKVAANVSISIPQVIKNLKMCKDLIPSHIVNKSTAGFETGVFSLQYPLVYSNKNAKYMISSEFENILISEHRIQNLLLRSANIYSLINGKKKKKKKKNVLKVNSMIGC